MAIFKIIICYLSKFYITIVNVIYNETYQNIFME